MDRISEWEVIARLLLSGILSSLIGLERESHGRPAGLRTHILVALGSCLVMIISIYGFSGPASRDPARLAAQVVSGIGFLGAGTILREGVSVKGLTTAASLWVVAGIGLAMGCGFYLLGLVTTVLSVLTLLLLEPFEKKLFSFKTYHLEIKLGEDLRQLSHVTAILGARGRNVKHMELDISDDKKEATLDLIIEAKDQKKEQLLAELTEINGVNRIIWK